jgi:hypothetical protein
MYCIARVLFAITALLFVSGCLQNLSIVSTQPQPDITRVAQPTSAQTPRSRWALTINEQFKDRDGFVSSQVTWSGEFGVYQTGTWPEGPRLEIHGSGTVTKSSTEKGGTYYNRRGRFHTKTTCPTHTITHGGPFTVKGGNSFTNVHELRIDAVFDGTRSSKETFNCHIISTDVITGEQVEVDEEKNHIIKIYDVTRDIPLKSGSYDRSIDDFELNYKLELLENNRPPCQLHITSQPQPYVLCIPDFELPFFAEATKGGWNYKWKIVQGSERVHITGILGSDRLMLGAQMPSVEKGDVVLEVSYEDDGGPNSCSQATTVSRPASLEVVEIVSVPLQEKEHFWVMGEERLYQVLDQFGDPLPQEFLEITEQLRSIDLEGKAISWSSGTRKLSFNPSLIEYVGPEAPALDFSAETGVTNQQGRFQDNIYIFRDTIPFPTETDVLIQQKLYIEECHIGNFASHFLADSMSVEPK